MVRSPRYLLRRSDLSDARLFAAVERYARRLQAAAAAPPSGRAPVVAAKDHAAPDAAAHSGA